MNSEVMVGDRVLNKYGARGFAVSIPRFWARKNGLKKLVFVSISNNGNDLVVSPQKDDGKPIKIRSGSSFLMSIPTMFVRSAGIEPGDRLGFFQRPGEGKMVIRKVDGNA